MRSRDRTTLLVGLVALGTGVLAVGGAPRYVVVLLGALAAITAATQIRSHRRLDGVSPLLVFIGVAVVLTGIQLIPLPDSIVGSLSPTSHELILDGEALLDPAEPLVTREADGTQIVQRTRASSSWHPLSSDASTTRTELAKFCAYLLIAWMALRAAAAERGRYFLLCGVAGIAGVVALCGVVHELLGATALFGIYTPANARPVVMAPLLNGNHLACLMMFGAITAGGLALHERRAPPIRALWILITIVCILVGLATRSRGGVLGLAAGATVASVVIVLQRLRAKRRRDRRDVLRVVIPGAVILLCSLVLVVYVGGAGARNDLEQTRLSEFCDPHSKFGAWRSSLALIGEAPILGVGRGGFESAFTRVHDVSGQVTFSHVENEYLQLVIDWGIVGAIAFAIAAGLCLLRVMRRWRDGPLAAAAIGGLSGVAVHSVVDFGMEIPGLALPVILVASTLLYVPLVAGSRPLRRYVFRGTFIAVALATALLAALPSSATLSEDHAAFADDKPSLEEARAAFQRHPLDYLSSAYIARSAQTSRERVAFLNHAMRLHPTHPGLHRAAAVWLAESGRKAQSAFEFRQALLGSGEPEMLLGDIVKYFPRPEDAALAIPETHPMWHRIVIELGDIKRNDIALQYMLEIVKSNPGPPRELWLRIESTAEKLLNYVAAERAAVALLDLDRTVGARNDVARIQILGKRFDAAKQTLQFVAQGQLATPEHVDARLMLCGVHIELKEWTPAHACLTELLGAPIATMATRRKIHRQLATVEDALGNPTRAAFERKLSEQDKIETKPDPVTPELKPEVRFHVP